MRFVRSVGISGVPRARFVSPGYAIMLVGVGHAIWGLIAYHDPVWDLIRAGFVGSVGDGIFDTTDAKGPRAAAFWFLLTAPFLVLAGYLVEGTRLDAGPHLLTRAGPFDCAQPRSLSGAAGLRQGLQLACWRMVTKDRG
jgi:hypothetical protein